MHLKLWITKHLLPFVFPNLTFNSVRLTDNITIFTAELCAIKLVISNSDKNVCIFSDSYSSLQAIASGKSNCRPNLLLQIISFVSNYSKKVDFVWLPSHIGIKGNELADKLANAAIEKPSIDVNIGLELSEAYTLIDRYILGRWQHLWNQETRGSHYRSVEKKLSPPRSNISIHPGTPRSS